VTRALDAILAGRRALLVVAVDAEANAIRRGLGLPDHPHAPWSRTEINECFDLVVTGVGKSNAAGGTARTLDPIRHAAVLNLGIAGALPRESAPPLPIGSTIAATRSILADEGMLAPSGFASLAQMGFAPIASAEHGSDGMSVTVHGPLLDALAPLVDATGPIATVSTCSANDGLAHDTAQRTGALAEAMEGAAVGTVALALGVPFLELRAISNTTGDRERQEWNIRAAFDALSRVASML
jgi:futalosine hydrolase